MDPRGHNHHHNYHRRDDREEEFYPPPQYGNQPPPPQVAHVHHTSHAPAYPPPPPSMGYEYDAPPPPSMGYEYDAPPPPGRGYGAPPPPSMGYDAPPPPFPGNAFVEHVSHQPHHPQGPSFPHHPQHPSFPNHPEVDNRPTVRVYCKAKTDYSLSIRDGKVILARPDPSDPFQHWIKDEKFSTRVKDEEGFPSFALVNKATGQALKHSVGATHPVQLIPYKPDFLDESVLWTLSHDTGENFRTIRMVNNIRLNVDAYNGDKYHGGIRDGTTIVLWEWKKGENQRWKIEPYYM